MSTPLRTAPDFVTPESEAPEQRTLPGERFTVYLADGTVFDVRVTNRERVLYERTAAKHRWPSSQDAPFTAITFCIWAAAKREGLTTLTAEAWTDAMEDFDRIEAPAVDPTHPAHGAD